MRSKGVADEAEDYALPIYAARFPVRTIIGEVEVCQRMPKDVQRPEWLAGFVAGRALGAIMTENFDKAYPPAVLSSTDT